jgi:UDP-N-acetylglucosamine--N-acetylmuramyl-(pentapeptide) pyrophosphoryl-undecaprenol N-acetylglucosamine transferase
LREKDEAGDKQTGRQGDKQTSRQGNKERRHFVTLRQAQGKLLSPCHPVIFSYVGEAGSIEEALAQRAGIPFRAIATGQIRGRAPWTVARNLICMARGAAQAAAVLHELRPDVVFVTGGYVAAPVAWAAWRHHTPLLIYLPDLTPGLAIRLASRLATKVAVTFPEVARYFPGKAVVTGYPVRPELRRTDKQAARAALGLTDELPVLLVFGGSRGARSINRALMAALPRLLPRCQIVHITGQLDWPEVEASAGTLCSTPYAARYQPYPYLHDEMVQALAAADLVVARAGASTLGEFPAVGLPSVLVPYPYAGQHQAANAAYLADRGAALVLADSDLPDQLASTVSGLLDTPGKLTEMSKAAAALARPDAAQKIAYELCQLTDGSRWYS